MDVRLLGNLHVTGDDGATIDITGQKMRTLFARLAIENGRIITADRLIEDLWGADPPTNSGNSLQSLVSKLRRAVGDASLIVNRGAGYQLDLPASAIDINRFEALVSDARIDMAAGRVHAARSGLESALRLWRDDPLAEMQYDDFAQQTIARLTELRLGAVEERIEIALLVGDEASVIPELERLIAEHPLRERLRCQLMLALYRCGRQGEALRAYEATRVTLAEELGLDPGPELKKLHAAILDHDPALAAPARAPRPQEPSAVRPGNLPIPLTPLIGRADDVVGVDAMLDRHRLVTLVGPGGAGKTRLALEVARGWRLAAAATVWMIELAPLEDADGVGRTIATTIGVADAALPPAQSLRRHFADHDALLVLDNCEHVIGAAAHVAADLLSTCPGVRVLATSREALGVPGETVWPTPPLSVGDAAELFMQRATASAPAFRPDQREVALVNEICARLDGLPLAVEPAAARIRSLSVEELAARLDDRFRLLSAGARTALQRQQTLRAVIDWSYDLLSQPERTLLDRLSVFVGACSAADATAVCADAELSPDDVGDALVRLVDKSLVSAEHAATSTRYRMLQTLALYGREHLAANGSLEQLRDRHTEHFVALLSRSESAMHGDRQQEWMHDVRSGLDDIRVAFRAAVAAGDASAALTLAGGLGWFWWVDGGVVEGSDLLQRALALDGPVAESTRVVALTWAAYLSMHAGRGDRSEQLTEEALEAARAYGDPTTVGPTCMLLATRAMAAGDIRGAAHLFEEAATAFAAVPNDPWAAAALTFVRAEWHHAAGDRERAAHLLGDAADRLATVGDELSQAMCNRIAADLADARGDQSLAATLLAQAHDTARRYGLTAFSSMIGTRLATLALANGDLDVARVLLAEAEQRGRQLGYTALLAWSLNLTGVLLRHEQHLDEARAAAIEALSYYRTTPLPIGVITALHTLGCIAAQTGDPDAATRCLNEALGEAQRLDDRRATASVLEGLAATALAADDHQRAADLLIEANELRETSRNPPTAMDRLDIERVRAVLASATDHDTAVPNSAPMP